MTNLLVGRHYKVVVVRRRLAAVVVVRRARVQHRTRVDRIDSAASARAVCLPQASGGIIMRLLASADGRGGEGTLVARHGEGAVAAFLSVRVNPELRLLGEILQDDRVVDNLVVVGPVDLRVEQLHLRCAVLRVSVCHS